GGLTSVCGRTDDFDFSVCGEHHGEPLRPSCVVICDENSDGSSYCGVGGHPTSFRLRERSRRWREGRKLAARAENPPFGVGRMAHHLTKIWRWPLHPRHLQ